MLQRMHNQEDVKRYLLIQQLDVYLLPELMPLILYYTFAPYEVEGILRNKEEGVSRPLILCRYRSLPTELLYSEFSLNLRTMRVKIKTRAYGILFLIQTPHKLLPISYIWPDIDKLSLNHLFRRAINCVNREFAHTGVIMSLK